MSISYKECNDVLWNKSDDTTWYCFQADIQDIYDQLPIIDLPGLGESLRIISNPFSDCPAWFTSRQFVYNKKLKQWYKYVPGKGQLIIYQKDELDINFQ